MCTSFPKNALGHDMTKKIMTNRDYAQVRNIKGNEKIVERKHVCILMSLWNVMQCGA